MENMRACNWFHNSARDSMKYQTFDVRASFCHRARIIQTFIDILTSTPCKLITSVTNATDINDKSKLITSNYIYPVNIMVAFLLSNLCAFTKLSLMADFLKLI